MINRLKVYSNIAAAESAFRNNFLPRGSKAEFSRLCHASKETTVFFAVVSTLEEARKHVGRAYDSIIYHNTIDIDAWTFMQTLLRPKES